jgi:hypothetical protein
MFLRSYI